MWGHLSWGSLTWKPAQKLIDAVDAAFYATFQSVEPCGKPMLLVLGVSGSMGGSMIAGSCLLAREGSAALRCHSFSIRRSIAGRFE